MKLVALMIFVAGFLFINGKPVYADGCSCVRMLNPVTAIDRSENLLFASTNKGYVYKIDLKGVKLGGYKTVISLPYKKTVVINYRPAIFAMDISKNGKYLALSSALGLIAIYRLSDFSVIASRKVPSEDAFSLKFLNGNELVFGTIDGRILLWDFSDNKLIYNVQIDQFPIIKIAISPNKKLLAVADKSSVIKILDAATGRIKTSLKGHKDSLSDIVFAGSSILYSASKDWQIIKWNLSTKHHWVIFKSRSDIGALCYDKSSANLAFASSYSVLFFNTAAMDQYKKIECHSAPINRIYCGDKVCFSAGSDSKICREFE